MKTIKDSRVDWIQIVLIGLVAPFFIFPSMKYIWVLCVVPGIWILRWMVKKEFFEKTILDWAIIILFIQVFITCIIVPDIGFSLPKIAGVLFGLAVFYSLVALLKSEKLIKLGIFGFLCGGFFLSVGCLLGGKWCSDKFVTGIFPKASKIILKIGKNVPKIRWNLPGAEEGFNSNAIAGILIVIFPFFLVISYYYLRLK